MRIGFLLIALIGFFVLPTQAQDLDSIPVTLHHDDTTLSFILQDLNRRYPIQFFLSPSESPVVKKSINVDSVPIQHVRPRKDTSS